VFTVRKQWQTTDVQSLEITKQPERLRCDSCTLKRACTNTIFLIIEAEYADLGFYFQLSWPPNIFCVTNAFLFFFSVPSTYDTSRVGECTPNPPPPPYGVVSRYVCLNRFAVNFFTLCYHLSRPILKTINVKMSEWWRNALTGALCTQLPLFSTF
jgi:hypothetical protein